MPSQKRWLVSVKSSKYFYLPLAGQISVKSVFPEFARVLVSHPESFLGKGSLDLLRHKTGIWLRQPELGMANLGLSSFVL